MIKSLKAREILDSRGNPTVEACLETDGGLFTSSVPSGASTGAHEAVELRDNKDRYMGKGVLKAVDNINNIITPKIIGKDPMEVDDILIKLDGTKNKSYLGANAMLAVSVCAIRAKAEEKNLPVYRYISLLTNTKESLPRPCFNIINGGSHAGGGAEFQEFMIVPNRESFSENLLQGVEIYHKLKQVLQEKYGKQSTNIGDEGGFVPGIKTVEETLQILREITDDDIFIDVAASEFMIGNNYKVGENNFKEDELLSLYESIIDNFSVSSLEDPFGEDSFSGWENLVVKRGDDILIVGDDLLVTNTERMKIAKQKNLCNAMILKMNQIGTIKETLEAVALAREFDWKIIVSHRSGETNDDFISDLAVGIGSEYIKTGAPARGERVAKYNRLLQIEKYVK